MPKEYDLIVIGAGTAAMVAATRTRAAGKHVAIVDFRPYGGTCALRGCDPKKMLISGSQAFDHAKRMHGKGIFADVRLNWQDLIAFKRSFTDPIPEKHEERYTAKGIDTYHGLARFTGRNDLNIEGQQLRARHILVATGAEPVELGIPGEDYLINNEDFLSRETLPERIVLVGGGYIASEFSHIAARAGAQVTILQRGKRMLTHFDSDLVGWLMDSFQSAGIDVRTQAAVEAIEKTGDGFRVRASHGDQPIEIEADWVVHAAGRAPALEALNLDAAEVAVEHGKLKLNDYLQSVSNPSVYAAGDAAQMGPPLTPVSSHDAKVVVANLLEGNHQKPDYRGVPSVAFTLPPIAAVGLTEAQAIEQGLKFQAKSQEVPNWFTARQAAQPVYGFKVLIEDESDHVLGAHLVGPQVDEVINIFALAIRHGLTAQDLKSTMFAYPTGASDIGDML
jgi:glutathione reductase (NADPH)